MRQYVGMGLSTLLQTLVEEPTTIDERIGPINEVLAAVEYGHGGHLQIVTRDTEPGESKEFRKEISAILENMLGGRVTDDRVLVIQRVTGAGIRQVHDRSITSPRQVNDRLRRIQSLTGDTGEPLVFHPSGSDAHPVPSVEPR